jgi:uncharacterized protein
VDLQSYQTGAELLAAAGSFLAAREVEHTLLMALAEHVKAAADDPARAPYLVSVRQGDRIVAVVARTPPHYLVLSHIAPVVRERVLDLIIAELYAQGATLPGATGPVEVVERFATRWGRSSGRKARERHRQRVFELEQVTPPSPQAPGALRLAREGDLDVLVKWANAFIDDTGLPEQDRPMAQRESVAQRIDAGNFHVWERNGELVSMASVGGTTRVPRIGLVYTPPEARRQGFASACVAAISQQKLEAGAWRVSLITDAANETSNKIYQAVGYRPVGEQAMYSFG